MTGLWQQAREALEQPKPAATFRLALPDDDSRRAVGEVYGRPMTGLGTRLNVAKLDEAVRARFGLGLEEVLEILHGRPVTRASSPARQDERLERVASVLEAALAEHGLSGRPWTRPWIEWWNQYGRVAREDLELTARRAAGALAHVVLDPEASPRSWIPRADLATQLDAPYQLDSGTALSRVVLKAIALAHGVEAPTREHDRHALWERVGVTSDGVSATVACWALPLVGADPWSRGVLDRTELGLPTHLTHRDLAAAPDTLVPPGSVIAVCENPRVLEAAVHEGIRHPLLCLSGRPSTVALQLLDRLAPNGARLRHHGDFDWPGVSILNGLWSHHQVRPWRMSAADYREELDRASQERLDLPPLIGTPVDTPWDPALRELMAGTGQAVDEEVTLVRLLDDLRDGSLH
ncbi:TIGR02679 family protein [Allosaccharopolyspora coralli]|uniref:TIGR02679 family protein n=1 Tax=Allosaccharopolyspora coralli TaxID=2665642 RepID=A0A5Q3QCB8_9PSEU|nr:TIGR02679 family protein [Allosaccharopolyspora coralli]